VLADTRRSLNALERRHRASAVVYCTYGGSGQNLSGQSWLDSLHLWTVSLGRIGALLCERQSLNRVIRSFSRHACQFYAATRGTTLSTNRRNRELRAPATISTCDASSRRSAAPTGWPSFVCKLRFERPPATKSTRKTE